MAVTNTSVCKLLNLINLFYNKNKFLPQQKQSKLKKRHILNVQRPTAREYSCSRLISRWQTANDVRVTLTKHKTNFMSQQNVFKFQVFWVTSTEGQLDDKYYFKFTELLFNWKKVVVMLRHRKFVTVLMEILCTPKNIKKITNLNFPFVHYLSEKSQANGLM